MANCSETLFKREVKIDRDLRYAVSYLSQMSKSEWDKKRQAGTLDAILPSAIIGVTYEAAQDWASSIQSKLQFNFDKNMSEHILINELDPSSVEIYKACVRGVGNYPLTIWLKSSGKNFIIIEGKWDPTGQDAFTFKRLAVHPIGAKLAGPVPKPGPNGTFNIQFQRDSTAAEATILVQAVTKNDDLTYDDQVLVPEYIEITQKRTIIGRSSGDNDVNDGDAEKFVYRAVSDHISGSKSFSIRSKPNFRILPNSVSVAIDNRNGNAGGLDGKVIYTGHYQFSGNCSFSHNPNGAGARNGEHAYIKIEWQEECIELLRNGISVGYLY